MNEFPKLGINTEKLIAFVEECIEDARDRRNVENFGPVNWGDIGVTDVEYRLSMMRPSDGPECVVTIEEAGPECHLARWINERLFDREGEFPKTYVVSEW